MQQDNLDAQQGSLPGTHMMTWMNRSAGHQPRTGANQTKQGGYMELHTRVGWKDTSTVADAIMHTHSKHNEMKTGKATHHCHWGFSGFPNQHLGGAVAQGGARTNPLNISAQRCAREAQVVNGRPRPKTFGCRLAGPARQALRWAGKYLYPGRSGLHSVSCRTQSFHHYNPTSTHTHTNIETLIRVVYSGN